jgi:hypothetical protein
LQLPPTIRGAPWSSAIHPGNLLSRAFYGVFNLVMRLTHSSFRGFAQPPGAMLAALEDHGLRRTFQRRSRIWQIAGLERVWFRSFASPLL